MENTFPDVKLSDLVDGVGEVEVGSCWGNDRQLATVIERIEEALRL